MQNCKTSAGTAAQKRSKSSWLARLALLLAIPMLGAVSCRNISHNSDDLKAYSWDSLQLENLAIRNKDSLHNTFYGCNTLINKKIDTTIMQDVWYDENYHLQTYIKTNESELHPRSGYNVLIGNNTKFCMYINEINGSFKFIKQNKNNEYMKAKKFLTKERQELKKKKQIPSNVKFLKDLKVGDSYSINGNITTIGVKSSYPDITGCESFSW